MQDRSSSNVTFIDVSHWEGSIDWNAVKASGIQAAYAKAKEGVNYIDPTFVQNVQAAKNANVLIGAYHFAHPEQNDAISEAKYFVSILQSNQTDLIPVLDLESPTDPSNSNLTGTAISNWARSFIDYVKQATGKNVMLYTGVWYINEFGISGLSDIPLWISRYSSTPPADAGGWTEWTAWKYTDSGQISGVGNCDVSAAVSIEALQGSGASGGNVSPPTNATAVYGVAVINGDNVNLRSGPSLQSSVIRQLNRGESYEVLSEQGSWLALGGNEWIYDDSSYVQYKHYVATITGDNVNLRDAPSLNGNVIRQLHHGEAYRVWCKQDGWLGLGGNKWIYDDSSYIHYGVQ
ncbi:N-acetylmuramoyl-L-alanine amidase [Bacillus cereus]|uniref:GH25 family lysozyme n=1 Tax=Bacillus sp. AW TaxID=2293329 RepID=UPI000BF79729|nr:SH3 domain-containing protein [Bacillus wiedmannii]PFM85053.1 N-acetylmuramoyl-L-alanine amidase [Bacillus cereus]PFQ87897.1 N-acetylmuramoyl-L-alanine amidase [Bacillus cereus]PGP33687.1 N-acetylmuramoyl-L-alanine amidase [Bacillus cereus]RFB68400.1 N-acetylmuramoyl-L-alanine amidase [Bacillus sp. AW]